MTWKINVHEPESLKEHLKKRESPIVLAHFHGDEIVLLSLVKRYQIATISSQSKDGEIMNTVIRLLGGKTTRGSSTRGAIQAFKGLIRLVKTEKLNTSFAVDGPKGPIYKVKPGVFEASRLLRAPIYFAGVHCNRSYRFPKSWNKTFFPKLFARVEIVWVGPWGPCDENTNHRDPKISEDAENLLFKARQSAEEMFAPT